MTIGCCASGRHHLQCYKAPQCYSPFIIDIWLSIEHSSDLYHWIKIMSQWINTDGFDDVFQATKIHQTSYKSRWRSTFESQLSIRAIEYLKLSAVIQISIWPGERHCAVSQNTHTHTRTAPVICIIQQNLNDRSLFQCVVVLRPSNHSNAVYGVRSPARPYLYIIMFERSSFHPCWLPCAMRPRHLSSTLHSKIVHSITSCHVYAIREDESVPFAINHASKSWRRDGRLAGRAGSMALGRGSSNSMQLAVLFDLCIV